MGTPLPRSVRIGPLLVAIVEDPVSRAAANRAEWDSTHVRINISPEIGLQRKRVSLAHELMHGVFDTQGRNRGGKFTEEEVCDMLAPALVELIRDNPDVIAYLGHREPET